MVAISNKTTQTHHASHQERFPYHIIIDLMESMRRHDHTLVEHGERTAHYSLALGRALNLAVHDLTELWYASLLHDLGKLTLPNEIVERNGTRTSGDYLMPECSPRAGADMLRPWPALQKVATLIAHHHERWDGTGDPFGIRGPFIPTGARVLAIADTFDQLTTQQIYGHAFDAPTALRIIRTFGGTRFDPSLVLTFTDVIESMLDCGNEEGTSTKNPEQRCLSSLVEAKAFPPAKLGPFSLWSPGLCSVT